MDRLSEPRGRGNANARADPDARLGFVPGFRRAVRRSRAQPGLRGAHHLGLSLQPRARPNGHGASPGRGRLDHAWAEIFLPGAGWITFDPTNRGVGGFNLIPVAVGRVIGQVMPLTGTFLGMTDAYQGMSVDVQVTP